MSKKNIITNIYEYLNESGNFKDKLILDLKENDLLKKYLLGHYMGKDNSELLNSLKYLIPLKDKYPSILKPVSNTFYRVDIIEKTKDLEYEIMDNATTLNLPFIKSLTNLTPDRVENITYKPINKIQGWTNDIDFAFEHWYNIHIQKQSGDYMFDEQNYFSCIYVLKDTTDLLFNEDFLDELRLYFGGNGEEHESLRFGGDVLCDGIVINDL